MTQGSDIRDTFFIECDELAEALNDGLGEIDAGIEDGFVDGETINAVFRAVHSIKGGAGAFGLEPLVRFAHSFETTLDALRSNTLEPTAELMLVLHRASDHLSDLIVAARDDAAPNLERSADLMVRLSAVLGKSAPADHDAAPPPPQAGQETAEAFGFVPMALGVGLDLDLDAPAAGTGAEGYRIRFVATAPLYANGNEPLFLFRALADLGKLDVAVDVSRLPRLEEMDWQEAYLDWTLSLATEEAEQAVREVFDFVDGVCELQISPLAAGTPPRDDPPGGIPLPEPVQAEEEEVAFSPPAPSSPAAPLGGGTEPRGAPDDGGEGGARKGGSGGQRPTVRVELDRVDRLINVVGELVINQAMLSQCVHEAGISPRSDVGAGLDEFRNLAREIQETVMSIRAQSVKLLFQRMSRIVREASDVAKKSAHLITEGESTEVDKTMIERLADPLTHMIRNAVDHGLESPEVRRKAGKPDIGTITLSAAHRSGRVMIEVSDDGAGINRPRVRQIAIDKGLIPPEAELTDAEIDKLLFLPGFSTAKTISDLSGRGVGMDVVRSAIQALGGRIFIASVPGQGTTFTISLPLTLAVLEGMLVDVAGQTMVVPITAIVETLRPPPADIHPIGAGARVVAIRGDFVPIIDLGAVFGYREPVSDFSERVLLLVETDQSTQCAFAVDGIYDQRQVVIKGLEDNYGYVSGVAAATILGDGKIALIVDPDEIVSDASPQVPFMAI